MDQMATVMKYNGSNWVIVGNPDFSLGGAGYLSLVFNPATGEPYVAYVDEGHSNKATVMKFDGNNWVNVGNAGFSAGEAHWTSLAFSPTNGQPFVAYEDDANSWKSTVMKYDSGYIGINELQESRLSLYPNPATDKITVELSGAVKESTVSIVNIEGQQLITHQITQPTTIFDVSNLPSGVYFVQLTNDRMVEVGKFVKQ
jgi:hypothetical protein